ncbi:hypothetical protein PG996_003031 [Apiospora saccharicola]|uniref:Uncharacterized protein n=1 Tax=Apiospora saccharicola TaxID=335842 RepID=A0ABR1W033_9PEZI
MAGSSDRSVYEGAAPSKPPHTIKDNTKSPSKKSMSQKKTKSYMSEINAGGDPVTALALRPGSSSTRTAKRHAKAQHEMDEALKLL